MTQNAKGTLTVECGEETYTLFLGMSVIADLQEKHGQDVLESLEPPKGNMNANWVPDLGVVVDVVQGALSRYHSDIATRWVADDILAEHSDILGELMQAAFPSPQGGAVGNGQEPKTKAA